MHLVIEHFYNHRVDFIWSLRQQEKVEWFLTFLTELRDVWDEFNIRIYLTSRNYDGIESGGLQLLDNNEIGKISVDGLEVYLGRADWSRILDEMVDYHLSIFGVSGDEKDNQIGVICCGQHDFAKVIEQECIQKSSPKCNFRFYGETF
ncbi:NADPH oxidase 5 isoform 2 [Reticulomyxa filosa]|uniref:NADPH oxidase 5 isoform 2 n=1 Tax=Reticulomyxa filosa TaxID=46433 RepID=X6LQF0_RETFI|nr:NADPH oxidase 5 isoform 2 [Reticulomyxa filosa]|eukprot:ETO03357.1 NADPH oxidase 5 isoform 2 [Reticulomyxa filosa]